MKYLKNAGKELYVYNKAKKQADRVYWVGYIRWRYYKNDKDNGDK